MFRNYILYFRTWENLTYKLTWSQKKYFHNELKEYLSAELPKHYSPVKSEDFWQKYWTKSNLYTSSGDKQTKKFSMIFPPPNVTGSLHLGHALTVAIQDAIIRHAKMSGYDVLFIPGFDHAGIATQMMVEKQIWSKERKTRIQLGREEFLSRVEDWARLRRDQIRYQLDKLGGGFDLDYEYFTLSPQMSNAVTEAFIKLFNLNLIYRETRLVNWSFYLQSTLSDIEIKHQEIHVPTDLIVPGCDEKVTFGLMHYVKYFVENSEKAIIVATTRPETIIGDVAIAVNPNDNKYTDLIGKKVVNPLTGKSMPIICDDRVDPNFGTGALKITPGHDITDYMIGHDHSLPCIDIFDEQGRLNCPELPHLHQVNRFKAKTLVKQLLQQNGLYCGCQNHKQTIPLCSRSDDIIELRITPQWFMKCKDLFNKSMNIIDDGYLKLIPQSYRNVWYDWIRHQKDWCISRQIWWGHRIPAWEIIINGQNTNKWVAAKCKDEALFLAKKIINDSSLEVKQDEDVLDTWFSSGLLPLTVFGWPQDKFKSSQYFPLNIMETGHDIIFFWVVRMTILSLALENKLPFEKILFHGMICDANGKKMSKSRGNVVDPLHLINGASLTELENETTNYYNEGILNSQEFSTAINSVRKLFPIGIPDCGLDALRLSLLEQNFKLPQVNFNAKHVVFDKKFVNKMYQTVKFFLQAIKQQNFDSQDINNFHNTLMPIDEWILSCLADFVNNCQQSFEDFNFNETIHNLKVFWVENLCDIYLECIKPIIYQGNTYERNRVLNVLFKIFDITLRCAHPFIPFITEELYQRINFALKQNQQQNFEMKSIYQQVYPTFKNESFLQQYLESPIQNQMDIVLKILTKIRMFKKEYLINKKEDIHVIVCINQDIKIKQYDHVLKRLAGINQLNFINLSEIINYKNYLVFEIEDNCYLMIGVDKNNLKDYEHQKLTVEDIIIERKLIN